MAKDGGGYSSGKSVFVLYYQLFYDICIFPVSVCGYGYFILEYGGKRMIHFRMIKNINSKWQVTGVLYKKFKWK